MAAHAWRVPLLLTVLCRASEAFENAASNAEVSHVRSENRPQPERVAIVVDDHGDVTQETASMLQKEVAATTHADRGVASIGSEFAEVKSTGELVFSHGSKSPLVRTNKVVSLQEKQETFILNKEGDNKEDAENVSNKDAEDYEDILDEEDEDAEDGNHDDDEEEDKLDIEAAQTGEGGKGGALLKPETKRMPLLHTDVGAPTVFVRDHGGPQKCEHVFNSSQCGTQPLWRLAENACEICNHWELWGKHASRPKSRWRKLRSSKNLCRKVGQEMKGTDSIMLDFDRRRRSTGKMCWHPSLKKKKPKKGPWRPLPWMVAIDWDDKAASFEERKTLCRCMQSFTEKCANDGIACLKDRVCRCPAVCDDFKKHAGCKMSYVYPTGSKEAATGASVNDELFEAALARSQRDGGAADTSESTLDNTNRIKEC